MHIPGGVRQGTCRVGAWVLCSCSWTCGHWILVLCLLSYSFFSVCFCHLRCLVIVIHRSCCSSVAISLIVGSLLCSCVVCHCDKCALLHMCITAHLSTLKFICQVFAESTSLLRSSCKSRTSSGSLELWQSFVSETNSDIFLTMPLCRSLM